MAYCRISTDCDVYAYHSIDGYFVACASPDNEGEFAVCKCSETLIGFHGDLVDLAVNGYKVCPAAFKRVLRELLADQHT